MGITGSQHANHRSDQLHGRERSTREVSMGQQEPPASRVRMGSALLRDKDMGV